MDKAIKTLLNRRSVAQLNVPYNQHELAIIYQSALTAPDHCGLKPWRFITVGPDKKNKLLQCYINVKLAEGGLLSEAERVNIFSKLNRSPNIVICIFSPKKHNKVPENEQLLSMGAAIQNMIVSASLLGGGAFWTTGDAVYAQGFKKTLRLEKQEQVAGILHIGKSHNEVSLKTRPDVSKFFSVLEA